VDATLRARLERALGAPVVGAVRVHGGDIHEAWRIDLQDGRRAFVKVGGPTSPSRIFECEAKGLAWLSEGPLRVPRVLAVDASFLALEWIERGRPGTVAAEALGRGLARLHRLGAPTFGLDDPNFLATIPLDNTAEHDWPTFYGTRRLEPLLRLAVDRSRATARMKRGIERVIAMLPQICGPPEPPARLHGDLWSGNVLYDASGAPVIFDPAVYGGHREVDLAMMRLFGGFDAEVFEAYHDEWPLADGWEERIPLYQLLPLLAHVVLFGGHYVAAVERTLDRIG
jgi:fructosamine-3-kinase